MSAIKIKLGVGNTEVSFLEPTKENVKEKIELLHELTGSWYAMAEVFSLTPNANATRLIKKWMSYNDTKAYIQIPVSQWKVLLMVLDGQEALNK